MRPIILAFIASAVLGLDARAGDLRNFDDAALHAVQFLDKEEGWAVGDDGAVWHTINAGQNWERQPTGVAASLRSVHFLNPYTGWVAGREELPHGAGSVGVLLFTQDGGLKWRRVGINSMPGLNRVRFLDNTTGFVAGDGTDRFPTGVFTTDDSGRTWKPVPGPRCSSWLAFDFQDGKTGALAGAWSGLATLRDGRIAPADVDILGARSLSGLRLMGNDAVAVGQGGLILTSSKTAGARWAYADVKLPTEVQAAWDFHAVHGVGDQLWVAGRPGSAVLHSLDRGQHWNVLMTGQTLPLNGLYFADERRGWAVGELGSILATVDGGRTWKVQRRAGQRAAVLFVHSRPIGLPVDTLAVLGGQEGYLAAALRVNGSDPGSAGPERGSEALRFSAAARLSGGAAGEMLWQFPLPQHLARADERDLVKAWDRLHADRSTEQLLRQLVLTLRIWRPDVVITDNPDGRKNGWPVESLLVQAVREAFNRAADPKTFPEQIKDLGLEPWRASKLYGRWETSIGSEVAIDLNEASAQLAATPRDFAAPAAGLLADIPVVLPDQRYFHLLASRIEGAANHRDLMQGVTLTAGGTARRELKIVASDPEVLKAIRARRNLQVLAETPGGDLADPAKLLAQVGPMLANLSEEQAPAAAFAVASQYARLGQWQLARELFLIMVDRYPSHPLTVDAFRWLVRHNSSSEARRRYEMGQFKIVSQTEFRVNPAATTTLPATGVQQVGASLKGGVEGRQDVALAALAGRAEIRQWYQGSLEIGKRLTALGPIFGSDPSIQFCLQAARRNLGDFESARQWYTQFRSESSDGPWRDAAAAELWLASRTGPPPRPVAPCRLTSTRPFLDGSLDDSCWKDSRPIVLKNAVGETAKEYPTEAWLAHDKDFLYLALRCRHPADRFVAPVKVRPHDADLRSYDRVSLLLDLDRDYSTYFHLQIDQRGCVCEDCWGDRTWNPRWFVAIKSDTTSWQIEAAIPMVELSGDTVTVGRAWACNVVRVVPGRGVQALSLPADVQPRPEGMGILMFADEPGVTRKKDRASGNGNKQTGTRE